MGEGVVAVHTGRNRPVRSLSPDQTAQRIFNRSGLFSFGAAFA
jgi:hypothetical protein